MKLQGNHLVLLVVVSLPTRERGLKLQIGGGGADLQFVAPHAGAWIETATAAGLFASAVGRSPRGSVD